MHKAQSYYPDCPEALIVSLAREGDRAAFEELVRRRQSSIRNLMRRCCGDIALADDLAQQVFLTVWQNIRSLKQANAFGGWLKKVAITIWLKHLRKSDALNKAEEYVENKDAIQDSKAANMDLNYALTKLSPSVRLCIVLSYHEGLTHTEIASDTEIPLGTVKSHIKRGTERLQQLLSAYQDKQKVENLS